MCYGTSHLRTAHPIRGQHLVSRIIIVKVHKRKNHGVTPWKEGSHKRGGFVKGAGRFFCHCFLAPEQGWWVRRSRRRASSGRKRDGNSSTAARGVSGESSRASWLLRENIPTQMCPSKISRSRHAAARTAGGMGHRGAARMLRDGLSWLLPRVDGKTHAAHGSFLLKLGKGRQCKGFFQTAQYSEKVLQRRQSRRKRKRWDFSLLTVPPAAETAISRCTLANL